MAMSILNKPLNDISISDLSALIEAEARETEYLEFKGSLPFRPEKGSNATRDRWIEKGDKLGDHAKAKLMAEVVAFANAGGGTLILGLHETDEEPHRAYRFEELPNCEALARRISDTAEDCIEPRLTGLEVRGYRVDDSDAGYVVVRVAKSSHGPHRSGVDHEFYVRRGERASKMTVREIHQATLETARTNDRIEEVFRERRQKADYRFSKVPKSPTPPFMIHVSAIPTVPQSIEGLTLQNQLWWPGKPFTIKAGTESLAATFPSRDFFNSPSVTLRGFECRTAGEGGSFNERFLRDDGLVEFAMLRAKPKLTEQQEESHKTLIHVGWVLELVAGTIFQIEHLRKHLAWDGVEYGLDLRIACANQVHVYTRRDYGYWGGGDLSSGESPVSFEPPRYSLRSGAENIRALMTAVFLDILNSCGIATDQTCDVALN